MTLKEMKVKVLSLIEELNLENTTLTDDPDISAKINEVINQIQFELVRIKKLAKYVEFPVTKGSLLTYEDLEREVGYEIFQINCVGGVNHLIKADGTVIKVLESGTLELDCYVYPERITAETKDSYEFELSSDVLEIMPYGVASDLLKSDISSEYGAVYATRYESMLQRLDPRNHLTSISINGGVNF